MLRGVWNHEKPITYQVIQFVPQLDPKTLEATNNLLGVALKLKLMSFFYDWSPTDSLKGSQRVNTPENIWKSMVGKCISSWGLAYFQGAFAVTPLKPTWHWKISIFNRKYIFKWWVFHCHVSFRGVVSGSVNFGGWNVTTNYHQQIHCRKPIRFVPVWTCDFPKHSSSLLMLS